VVAFSSSSYSETASYAQNGGTGGGSTTGSFTGSFTGSVLGTASYALNSLTSSYAVTSAYNFVTQSTVFTASYVSGSNVDGSVVSSSYALTASYALNGGGTGTTNTGSFTGSFTGSVLGSASYALTASYALSGVGGVSVSASFASTASLATEALTARNALTTGTLDTSQGISGSLDITGGIVYIKKDINLSGNRWNQIISAGDGSSATPLYAQSTVIQSSSVGINTGRSTIFTTNPNLSILWHRAYGNTAESLFKTTIDSASLYVSTASINNQVTVTNREVFINANSILLAGSRITSSGVIKGSIETASFVVTAQTASFVNIARTASWVAGNSVVGTVPSSFTASFITTAQTASFVNIARTASWVSGSNVVGGVNSALTASFISSFSYPGEIHVSTGSGDDTTGNGTIGNPYQTIPKAISVAGTGSTIYIHPGNYNQSFAISASAVSIVGQGPTRGSTTIGNLNFRNTDGNTSKVSNLEIQAVGFNLTSSAEIQNCNIGIVAHTGAGVVTIIGSTITGLTILGNNALKSQTLIYIGSTFTSIQQTSTAPGTVWVQGCRFQSFGIDAGSTGTIHIDNSILTGTATAAGGVVYVSNTKFIQGNTSITGGRFAFSNGTRYSLQNVVYDKDYSSFIGAVITSSYDPSSTYFYAIGITSSLLGTASYATLAKNSETASFLLGSIASASFAFTASYVQTAQTASFFSGNSPTASYVQTAQTASFVTGSNVRGIVSNATTASYVDKSYAYLYKQALATTFTVSTTGTVTGVWFPSAFITGSSKVVYNNSSKRLGVLPGTYEIFFSPGQVVFPAGFTTTGWVNYQVGTEFGSGEAQRGHIFATGSNGNAWNVPYSTGIFSVSSISNIVVTFFGNCGSISCGGTINGSAIGNGWQLKVTEV
jgi:hypothetical protein